jgi:hypothetical protein
MSISFGFESRTETVAKPTAPKTTSGRGRRTIARTILARCRWVNRKHDALRYLDLTMEGKQWTAILYSQVVAIEHNHRRMGPEPDTSRLG